jgi:hypothetical protein
MSDEQQYVDVLNRFRNDIAPTRARIDEHAVWYEAGYAAGRGERRTLRTYAAAMTAASAVLAFALLRGDSPQAPGRGLARPVPQPASPQVVWTLHGVRLRADGTLEDPPREPLPDAAPVVFQRSEPATARSLLRELLSTEPTEAQPPREPEARVVTLAPRGVV